MCPRQSAWGWMKERNRETEVVKSWSHIPSNGRCLGCFIRWKKIINAPAGKHIKPMCNDSIQSVLLAQKLVPTEEERRSNFVMYSCECRFEFKCSLAGAANNEKRDLHEVTSGPSIMMKKQRRVVEGANHCISKGKGYSIFWKCQKKRCVRDTM